MEKAKEGIDRYGGLAMNEWTYHKDILSRSIQYAETLPQYSGFSLFSFQFLFNPLTGEEVEETKEEIVNLLS